MARRRESSSAGKWVAIVMIMLVIMLCLAAYLIMSGNGNSNPVTKGIQREVTKKAVDKVVTEQSGGSTSLGEIESQMSEDDADTFNEIVDKYSESGLVSEALSIYSANGGDVGATAEELRDKVDPEDIETLKELYSRYAE